MVPSKGQRVADSALNNKLNKWRFVSQIGKSALYSVLEKLSRILMRRSKTFSAILIVASAQQILLFIMKQGGRLTYKILKVSPAKILTLVRKKLKLIHVSRNTTIFGMKTMN